MDYRNQEIQYTKLFINNRFVDAKSGKTYDNYNPTTGRVLVKIAEADQNDVNFAVECAKRAFYRDSEWRKMSSAQRGHLLYKLADLMEQHYDAICHLEVIDHGKPLFYAKQDIDYAIKTIRYYAGYADKYYGQTIPIEEHCFSKTLREPYGVVGQILPANNPTVMFAWKLAPALAAGNTIVMKPARQTPLMALYIANLTKQVGFPDGVINIVCGHGETVGRAIVNHQDIYKIAFSGHTKNGKDIMHYVAQSYLKDLTLNLSFNNPLFVFKDFDVNDAARIAHESLFRGQGLHSSAAHRVYVHEDHYDEFVKRSVELARSRKTGDVFDMDTQYGAIVDEEKMNRILNFIEVTKKEGARLEFGGRRHGTQGYFIEPTVFTNCQDNMRCAYEDLYGPVQYIFKYTNYDELIDRANKCYYGLAAGILTHNIELFNYFVKYLQYGNVWINDYQTVFPQTPYGGYKQSGWGRELGYDGLNEYLQTKAVTYGHQYLEKFQLQHHSKYHGTKY